MDMQWKSILVVFLICLIPSSLFAGERLKTGYDLYHNIKLMDNPQTAEQVSAVLYTTGYLAGYMDGLVFLQAVLYKSMFPEKYLSEKERNKLAKDMKFHRINIPESGLAAGQLMLIFKKFAEKHPEKLNGTVRACIFMSLVEAYGWK